MRLPSREFYNATHLPLTVQLAEILPVGSKILGAQGTVDLIGRFSRQRLLFHVGKGAAFSTQTIVAGKKETHHQRPDFPVSLKTAGIG